MSFCGAAAVRGLPTAGVECAGNGLFEILYLPGGIKSRPIPSSGAGETLKQGERVSAAQPQVWNVPETDYLKFYIFQVV